MYYWSRINLLLTIVVSTLLIVGDQWGYSKIEDGLYSSEIVQVEQSNDKANPLVQEKVGIVLSAKGKAFVLGADGKKRKLTTTSPLYIGDRIQTKKRSILQISFVDGSTLRLTQNSDYTIDAYQFDEEKSIAVSKGSTDDGTLGFLAGKIAKIAPQDYKIVTATATIGIRGSGGEFTAVSGENASLTAKTLEGHVLEIETDFGNFVLDDPRVGLIVTLTGVKMIDIQGSLIEKAEEAEEEEEEEEEAAEEEESSEEEEGSEEGDSAEAAGEDSGAESDSASVEPETSETVEVGSTDEVDFGSILSHVAGDLAKDRSEVTDDYKGQLVGFTSSSLPSFSSDVGVRKQESDEKLIVDPKDDRLPYTSRVLDLTEFDEGSYNTVIQRQSQDLETGVQFNMFHDNVGEFFILNENSFGLAGDGKSTFSSIYFGEANRKIPNSGIRMYGTDLEQITGNDSSEDSIIVGSLLTRNNTILDIGSKSKILVDYSSKRVFGVVEDSDKPLTLYYGELKKIDGSIRNVHVYSSFDYLTLDPLSVENDLLNDLKGGGQIYGSSSQGVGIYANSADETGHFIASGFKYDSNPSEVSSPDGDYLGYAQGMKVSNSDPNTYNAIGASAPFEGVDPLKISVNFDNNNINGAMFLSGNAVNIGGISPSIAYNREFAFGELSSFSLPLEPNSSFLTTWKLPKIVVDPVSGATAVPGDTMWGSWNMVGLKTSNKSPDIYPALNNFWVAGKRKYGSLAGPISYYKTASLGTFLHTDEDSFLPKGSLEGVTSFVLDKDQKTFQALANFGNTYFIPVKGEITSVNLGTMVANEWSVLSSYGENRGLFSSALSENGVFQARLSGSDGGPNLLYEFQRSHQTKDIAYGVGLGVQTSVASDVGIKDFRGFSSGILLGGKQLIDQTGMILNFDTPLLHSDLTWFSFGNSDPFVIPSYDSRSVLRMDVDTSANPDEDQLVSFRTSGDFGTLGELTDFSYTYFIDTPYPDDKEVIVPRVSLFVDSLTPEVTNIFTNNSFTSTPVILESGGVIGEWVTSNITQDVGGLWLVDSSDPLSPRIHIETGGGEVETISLLNYDGDPGALVQTLQSWFEDPSIGDLLKEAKIKGVEITFNAADAPPQGTIVHQTAYIDSLKLSSSSGVKLEESWDVDSPIAGAVYINKDTFYVPEANRYLPIDEIGGGFTGDNSTSYIVSLPGLEEFTDLSWGMWGSNLTGPSGEDRAFGFYAIGDYDRRTTLSDREAWLIANPTIINDVVSYSGKALGAVFGVERDGSISDGTAVLNVNFNTGSVHGLITLPKDSIQLSTGQIDFLESFGKDSLIYHGATIMNNANFEGGGYRGQFFGNGSGEDFARESAGTFSGFDGERRAVGAFGVKKK